MKKNVKKVILSLALVLIVLLAALLAFPGMMVKTAANTVGSLVLGVDVRLDKAKFLIYSGKAELNGLFIGNPKGFNTKSLCEVGTIRVDMEPSSLGTDTIVINEIFVDSPVFTYQKSLLQSNVSALLKNLEGDKKKEDKEKEDAVGKKVVINKILIKDPMVKLSIKGIPMGAPIPMPDIELADIGKEGEGATVRDALETVFGAVLSSVTKIVTGSVKIVGKGGAVAVGGVKAVGGGLLKVTKGVAGAVTGSGESDDAGPENEKAEQLSTEKAIGAE